MKIFGQTAIWVSDIQPSADLTFLAVRFYIDLADENWIKHIPDSIESNSNQFFAIFKYLYYLYLTHFICYLS